MIWAQADGIVEKIQGSWIYIAIAIGILFTLYILYKIATGKKQHLDLDRGLRENLAEYPTPPANKASRRLEVDGIPARLRLVVVAPVGRQNTVTLEEVPGILDDVVRGLGGLIKSDKPRVKVWPGQLSIPGFAPTFHRLVSAPSGKGRASKWIKVAGPAKQGKTPYLIGLALLADEESTMGDVNFDANDWADTLQLVR